MLPACQRQGIGTQLVQQLLHTGCRRVCLLRPDVCMQVTVLSSHCNTAQVSLMPLHRQGWKPFPVRDILLTGQNEIQAYIRTWGQALLEVRASNAPAIALYRERLGFTVVGRRRGYYAQGEDALLMALPLTGS